MDLFDMGEGFPSLEAGVSRVKCPVMVLGVQSDILMPVTEQKALADVLRKSGKKATGKHGKFRTILCLFIWFYVPQW